MSTDGVLRLLTWYLANGIAVHAVARDRDRPQDHRGLRGVGAVAGYTGLRHFGLILTVARVFPALCRRMHAVCYALLSGYSPDNMLIAC